MLRGTSAHNNGQALSADALRAQIKRLARKAGVTLPPGAPIHAGRHAFAHLMLDGGAAISEIADLMGHGDVRTTMRYLHERPEILQSIHARALHQADPAADS
ncbi:MAG: site-specific integrase [Acidobacteria bacterium]|nr:site-specific integrase [Acidobacteriota bacterium]